MFRGSDASRLSGLPTKLRLSSFVCFAPRGSFACDPMERMRRLYVQLCSFWRLPSPGDRSVPRHAGLAVTRGVRLTLARTGKSNVLRDSLLRGKAELENIAVIEVTSHARKIQVFHRLGIAMRHILHVLCASPDAFLCAASRDPRRSTRTQIRALCAVQRWMPAPRGCNIASPCPN